MSSKIFSADKPFTQPIIPQKKLIYFLDPFPKIKKTMVRADIDSTWNYHFVDPNNNKKAEVLVKKVTIVTEDALIENGYIVRMLHMNKDLIPPTVFNLKWYKKQSFWLNTEKKFRKKVIERFTKKNKRKKRGRNSGFNIDVVKVGDTQVSLNISGRISINGDLVFKEQDLQYSSQYQSNNDWDLEIEQTQNFTINGKIGDKFNIKIKQDSEADFDFENDMSITYHADEDDILQNFEAGNIGFSFQDGATLINKGGGSSNNGLFGFKMGHQFGPLKINTILAQENSQKQVKTISGSEQAQEVFFNDYDYVKDRLFFIDEIYRFNFYPLDSNLNFSYFQDLEIDKIQVYKTTNTVEGSVVNATAYYNLETEEAIQSESGIWVRMEQGRDFNYSPRMGYIQLQSTLSNEAIAVTYITVSGDTIGNYLSDIAPTDSEVKLRLIKSRGRSDPSKVTWPLMMKNAYYIGGSGTDYSQIEVDVLWVNGETGLDPSPTGSSSRFLNLFGLDTRTYQNGGFTLGPDNIIDNYPSIIDTLNGILMFPTHLPFAYHEGSKFYIDSDGYHFYPLDENLEIPDTLTFGSSNNELQEILPELNDFDGDYKCSEEIEECGPAMYFSSNMSDIISEHEFIIKVVKKEQSSSINLGFMIVEGSDEVSVNGKKMTRGSDYEIDSFSNEIRFIGDAKTIVMDPNVEIVISYEDHNLFNFDNRFIAGSSMRWDFTDNIFLGGTALYYDQSIIDKKVEVGREPMRNFIWDLNGTYQRDLNFVTQMVDRLPLIKTSNPSTIKFNGEVAQVISNPNSIESGIAYIDDFESSKHTSSPSIKAAFFSKSGPPLELDATGKPSLGQSEMIEDIGLINWYNPYCQVATNNIWPDKATSGISGDQKTITLNLVTNLTGDRNSAGIFTYLNEYDQNLENKKYVDLWINDSGINSDNFNLHIDLGLLSEDANQNGELDSEEDIYFGNGIIEEDEDTGLDGCFDEYENGKGGCLDFIEIDGEFILVTYDEILNTYTEYLNLIFTFEDWNSESTYCATCSSLDPNGDNFSFEPSTSCGENFDPNIYENYNGTEGNAQFEGFNYPDTEDLNNDKSLNQTEDYFTYSINLTTPTIEPITQNNNWKQYSIPLSEFKSANESIISWSNIKYLRIWVDADNPSILQDTLSMAKIEFVGNEWQELGSADINDLEWEDYEGVEVSVVNTEEHAGIYQPPEDIIIEKDYKTGLEQREQALSISFRDKEGINGIQQDQIIGIKKVLNIPQEGKKNFKIYKYLDMYVYAERQNSTNPWFSNPDFTDWENNKNVQIMFRLEKDEDNYYEIIKPLTVRQGGGDDAGWKNNDIRIDLEELTRKKLDKQSLETFEDVGSDGIQSMWENGMGGAIPEILFGIKDSIITIPCDTIPNELFIDDYHVLNIQYCEDEIGNILDNQECINFIQISNNGNCTEDTDLTISMEREYIDVTFPDIACNFLSVDGCSGDEELIQFENQICYNWNSFGCFPCTDCSVDDPNGDNVYQPYLETQDDIQPILLNTEGNGLFDIGEPLNDLNGDNIYSPPGNFLGDDLWEWVDSSLTNPTWEKIRIKGQPSIDNVKNIVVGVYNNTNQKVNGHIFINELRMTGVQRKTGFAVKFSGDLNVADMVQINANFDSRTADYHALQERLSTGNTKQSFSLTTIIKPDNFFNKKLGFDPVRVTYSESTQIPQFEPTQTDVVIENPWSSPDSIHTISRNYGISTGFKKSTKGQKFWEKYIIDNFKIGFQTNNKMNSNITKKMERQKTQNQNIDYLLNLNDNPNFIKPFTSFQKYFEKERDIFSSKIYYFPKKLSGKVTLNETDNFTLYRNNPDTTFNQSLKLTSRFDMTYEPIKKIETTYHFDQNNNLDQYQFNKLKLIEEQTIGRKTKSNEKVSFSLLPDMNWLKPKFLFNSSYTWTRSTSIDSIAGLSFSNIIKPSFRFSMASFLEKFFTPKTQGKSSRPRSGRSTSRNKKRNKKWIEVENELILTFLEKTHSFAKVIGDISVEYSDDFSANYNGILTSYKPNFVNKFFSESLHIDQDSTYTTEDLSQVNSNYSNTKEIKIQTNGYSLGKISIGRLYYQKKVIEKISTTNDTTISLNHSYLPFGFNENLKMQGIPFPNYDISIQQLHTLPYLNKIFKTISINHKFMGSEEKTINDGEESKIYKLNFSPLLGITTTTKNNIKVTLNGGYTQTVKESYGGGFDKDHSLTSNSSIKYTKKGGLEIPIFFLRDLDLENDITFNLSSTYSYTWKEVLLAGGSVFTINDEKRNFNIKPTVKYHFSNFVDFTFNYNYSGDYSLQNKWRFEKGGGFSVVIKLRG